MAEPNTRYQYQFGYRSPPPKCSHSRPLDLNHDKGHLLDYEMAIGATLKW